MQPLLRPHHFQLAGRLALLLAGLLFSLPMLAQAPVRAAAPSVGQILNPDGTLRPGARGSFDARGYQLSYGSGGAPVLRVAAAGDENWQSGFGVPGAGYPPNPSLARATVWAIHVAANGDIYVGGLFTAVGTAGAAHIARWNGTTWSALGTGTDGPVYAITSIGTDVYVGGSFSTAGGVNASNVARWNGTTWSAVGTGTDAAVGGLAASGTDLYASGNFTTAGGVSANHIARWNGSAWSALGSGLDGNVGDIAVAGSNVYATGTFTTAGGVSAVNIARWNGSAWSALGSGLNGTGYGLAVSGSNVYVTGQFTTAGGVSAANIARWDGTTWSALGTGLNSYGFTLTTSGTDVYVGGTFTAAGSGGANGIARWNGTAWSALGSGVDRSVMAVAVVGTTVHVGGDFAAAGGSPALALARWNGTAWSPVAQGLNAAVNCVAVSGSDVYVGGEFVMADGTTANRVVRWNGNTWSALGTGMGGIVYGLAVSGTDVYACGSFTTAGGGGANRIARWNGTAWSALGSGLSGGTAYAVAVIGSTVYVTGSFTTAGGGGANRIARWNGSAWSAMGAGLNGTGNSLTVSGSNLYVGGAFTSAGGVLANYIARWDGAAWNALGTGMNNDVNDIAVFGTDVYAVGDFTTAGGVSANRIARWDGSAWNAVGNNLLIGGTVNAVAVSSAGIFIGGSFLSAGSTSVSNVARWNGVMWHWQGSGLDANVNALKLSASTLYAGGGFLTVADRSRVTACFGAYALSSAAPTITSISPTTGAVGSTVVVTGTNLATTGSVRVNGIAGTITAVSATSISFVVGAGSTTGAVSLTTPYGTATGPTFTLVAPLTVSSVSPTRNLRNAAAASNVAVTFSAPMSNAAASLAGLQVFSNQRGGRWQHGAGGTATVSGNTLTFDPAISFKAGETVYAVATPAAQSTGNARLTTGKGLQFTVAATGTGTANFQSATPAEVAVGNGPYDVAVGDVDGDGDLDLVTANYNSFSGNTVSVRLNDGAGGFGGGSTVTLDTAPLAVALADMDGDGDLDLVTLCQNAGLYVRLNGGDATGSNTGVFSNGSLATFPAISTQLAVADFDGDGDLDAAVGAGSTVHVRLNGGDASGSGTGVLANGSSLALSFSPAALAAGDVDHDGDTDLVAANFLGLQVQTVLNGGDATGSNTGVFTAGTTATTVNRSTNLTLADVDADGDLDLLAGIYNNGSAFADNRVQILLNGGDATGSATGTFANGSTVTVGQNPSKVVTADVDADGDLDLLVACDNAASTSVFVARNNGNGTFAAGTAVTVGARPESVAAGDLDGDGDLDFVAANGGSGANSVSVRLNRGPVPTISSFTPTSGPIGTSVTITGTNLTAASSVKVNGTAGTIAANTATSLTFTVGAGSTTGAVSVTTNDGTATGGTFTVTAGGPSITSFTPASGPIGTSVTITGTNLSGATAARVNGTAGTITANTATSLTFTVGAGSTTGAVSVTTPGGTATGSTFTIVPAPTITSFTPTSGPVGTSVTITGTNLTAASGVTVNATAGTITANTATSLTFTVGAGSTTGAVSVTTAGGTATGGTFTIVPAPSITSFTPTSGPVGTSVTITGTDLNGATAARVNGTAGTITANTATSLTFTVGAGSTTGAVSVTTAGGTATGSTFTIVPAPTISSFTPASGAVGTSVTITGTNLTGATAARVNGTAGTITANTATSLTFTVGAGSTTGAVSVTTPGGTATGSTFTVTNAPTALSLSATSVAENTGANVVVGTFSTTDPDVGNTFTYTLVTGTGSADNGLVNILGNSLRITASPDFEAKNSYAVRVRTTDNTGLFFEQAFTITVTDVNEAPTALALSATSVAENAGINAVVGSFSTTDPDLGNTFTYSLVAGTGSADNALCNINGNNLRISANPDFETKSSYAVRVRTTDQNGLFTEQAFTLTVTNVNETPTALALSPTSVAENAGANAVVSSFSTTDPDAGNTFTYTLVTGTGSTDNALVNISGTSLRITANPDFETKTSYAVRVRTTDQNGLFFEQAFTLTVTNVNEAPTALALSNSNVAENAGSNAVVGTLSTTDPDAGNTFTYSLVMGAGSTDNALVNILGTNLRVTSSANFEVKSSYAVRVRTTDQNGLFFEQAFTISVVDVNETPTAMALSNNTVAENTGANAVVGTLSTTDPDAGSTFTYTLVTGSGSTDNALVNISGNSLRITANPDFETKVNYTFRVRATDQGGLFTEQPFTITITNINEAPTALVLSATSVAENTGANVVVGTFTTTDQDFGSSFTYSLVTGTGSADNALVNISGNFLRISASPDFEAKNSYAVRVRTTDNTGLFFEQTFTISVTNVNEAPTALALSSNTIAENTGANAVVGSLSTTDPDAGNTFTYNLVTGPGSTDNALVNISGANLRITANPDFETKSSYALRVRTTDQNGLFTEQAFTITITNVNEAPTALALAPQSVNENVAPNTTVGTFSTTDPDAANTFTYAFVAGVGATDNGAFTISGNQVQIAVSPDFETKPAYAIRVRTTDQGGLFFEQTFTISVIDLPEGPGISSFAPALGPEGTVVTLTGTDFTGTTGVSFNGTPAAAFTVVSTTQLQATVPVGATTGLITVTTGAGSNPTAIAFTVLSIFSGTFNQCLSTMPITSTGSGQWQYLRAANGELVAALNDQGHALGQVSLEFLLNQGALRRDAQGREYLDRNWHLTAQNAFAGQQVRVRFYARNTEFSAFAAANDGDGNDATSVSQLRLTQYQGANEDCQFANNASGASADYRLLIPVGVEQLGGANWFGLETLVADHFSEFYFNGGTTTLPVELVAFSARRGKGTGVVLTWKTASERLNRGFEVERSLDGREFRAVSPLLAGHGTSSQGHAYAWTDAAAPAAALYYRLRQEDTDGAVHYSQIVRVAAVERAAEPLTAWPNPATGGSGVEVRGAVPQTPLRLLDALGREIARATADAAGEARLATSGLAPGLYQLRDAAGRTVRLVVE